MSILADKNTRVLIQGITGTQASFHVKRSLEYSTKIVAGTSPLHGGEEHLG
ncbi:MAG: succinate--CoA ligase subunit alpha, partial [Alphaproteobacteria bacterium]|nr:succinate--CoA ligase subunit alpha [Alphaproteobacteria bacterium]